MQRIRRRAVNRRELCKLLGVTVPAVAAVPLVIATNTSNEIDFWQLKKALLSKDEPVDDDEDESDDDDDTKT